MKRDKDGWATYEAVREEVCFVIFAPICMVVVGAMVKEIGLEPAGLRMGLLGGVFVLIYGAFTTATMITPIHGTGPMKFVRIFGAILGGAMAARIAEFTTLLPM